MHDFVSKRKYYTVNNRYFYKIYFLAIIIKTLWYCCVLLNSGKNVQCKVENVLYYKGFSENTVSFETHNIGISSRENV